MAAAERKCERCGKRRPLFAVQRPKPTFSQQAATHQWLCVDCKPASTKRPNVVEK